MKCTECGKEIKKGQFSFEAMFQKKKGRHHANAEDCKGSGEYEHSKYCKHTPIQNILTIECNKCREEGL